jgi:uncharacterized protein YajQ (UPF0234 family)
MASFDVVSKIDMQEADNAVNQAKKEYQGRYDFKGSKAEIQWDRKEITLLAEDEYKVNALKDMVQSKMHKRGIDISSLKFTEIEKIGGMMLKIKCTLVQGIEKETAKKIVKSIKEAKLKCEAQIQDDSIRVSSKSRDVLQECMSFLKAQKYGIPIQFDNLRS